MFISQDGHVDMYIYVDSNNGCMLIDEHDIEGNVAQVNCEDINDAEYYLSLPTVHDVILIVPEHVANYIHNTYEGIRGY